VDVMLGEKVGHVGGEDVVVVKGVVRGIAVVA
jgi:hypothetical protein